MRDVEELLYEQRTELQKLQAPEELELRLRSSLENSKVQRKKISRGLVAAVIAFALMFTYSFDTLAYYSKKMMGYETITNANIAELNEEGAGQEIQLSHTFSNGVEVLLDGIMFDENELVAFYKIQSSGPKIDEITFLMEINGIHPLRYPAQGGSGFSDDDYTQIWVQSFEAPKFYEKWLSLDMTMIDRHNNNSEQGSIGFTLDRSKAMKRMVKQDIGEEVELENVKINLLSLTASRLNTTIEGIIEPLQPGKQELSAFDRKEQPNLRFDIFVDDDFYDSAYVGINPTRKDFKAETRGLPSEFHTIDFRNFRLVEMKMIDDSVDISLDTRNLSIDEDLVITKVYQEGDNTCIAIKSKGIPVMGLFVDDKQVKAVDDTDYSNLPVSPEAVERIYKFEGKNSVMTLMFKIISYTKYDVNDTVIVV